MSFNKKLFIFLMILLLCSSITISAQTLRSLADELTSLGREFYIGCAVPSNFSSADQTIVAREFNIVTCENDMKIGTISPSNGQFNYGGGDRIVNFARSNNLVVHGHAFVWHKYNPGWVDGTKNMMESYIGSVGNHFRGNIWGWDVVNEAFHRDGSYRIDAIGSGGQDGSSVFGQRQGIRYIEDAFRAARRADPNAKLIYNDYSIETLDAKFDGMFEFLKGFVDRGVPIDGVGFQMHVGPDFSQADAQGFAEKMQRLADIGLESYITEMDGGCPDNSPSGLERQAEIYYWITKACMDQPMCKALQVWGVRDNQSWRINPDDPVDRAVAPLIFNDSGNPKPAYYAIQKAMIEAVEKYSTPQGMLGDVDNNKVISIVDALKVAQHYVGIGSGVFVAENADVNRDGSINITDALMIAQYYTGFITEF